MIRQVYAFTAREYPEDLSRLQLTKARSLLPDHDVRAVGLRCCGRFALCIGGRGSSHTQHHMLGVRKEIPLVGREEGFGKAFQSSLIRICFR